MTGHQPNQALLDLLGGPLSAAGLDVETVETSSAGRRKLVRVLVDKDGGVTLDEIADATSLVSERLDSSAVFDDAPYTLEVTSPGVDRPLTKPRHWRRNVGRLVTVKLRDGATLSGRIRGSDETSATLDSEGGLVTVGYDQVAKACVQVEFNRKSPGPEAGHDGRDGRGKQ